MKTKRITALLMALALTAALSACGNIKPTQGNAQSKAETGKSEDVTEEEDKEEESETTKSETTESGTIELETEELEDAEIAGDEEVVAEDDSKVSESVSTAESKSGSKSDSTSGSQSNGSQKGSSQNSNSSQNNSQGSSSQSNSQGNSSQSNGSSNESQGNGSISESQAPASTPAPTPEPTPEHTSAPTPEPTPEPTPAPTPVHEHAWKEHTATRQVWISNWVTVEDYGVDRVCIGREYTCDCGWTTMDRNAMSDHLYNHALAGDPKNFVFGNVYEEQVVCIGSHQEDQGYYTDETYVDYHYCDCGATK